MRAAGFGDFTGAGRQDILWRNTADGSVDAWIMDGFTIVAQWFPSAVTLDWEIRGTPDVNGDRVNSILWSNVSTGQQDQYLCLEPVRRLGSSSHKANKVLSRLKRDGQLTGFDLIVGFGFPRQVIDIASDNLLRDRVENHHKSFAFASGVRRR